MTGFRRPVDYLHAPHTEVPSWLLVDVFKLMIQGGRRRTRRRRAGRIAVARYRARAPRSLDEVFDRSYTNLDREMRAIYLRPLRRGVPTFDDLYIEPGALHRLRLSSDR
jgi:hypothetical protein